MVIVQSRIKGYKLLFLCVHQLYSFFFLHFNKCQISKTVCLREQYSQHFKRTLYANSTASMLNKWVLKNLGYRATVRY